jgi:signal transduction histidine kinase
MELQEKNKELESFAYTVSHDLKDPIGVIVGYTQVMEDFLEKQKVFGAKHFVEGIKRNSEKIVRFIDDLLQLSRSGRVVEKFIETNTKTIVNQIKKEMADKEMIDPGFLRSGKLPKINADFDRLYLVFSNLITNAFKYRDRSRKLRISIEYEKQGDFHLFKVKDNGVGIDAKMAEEIFKPGVRLRTVDAMGSGFGLRIIQKIIEAHGGKIWVESKPSKGSIFYFTIKDFPAEEN